MDCEKGQFESGYQTFDKMNSSSENLPSQFELIPTFTKWKSPVSTSVLTVNGFKYTGIGDTVECVRCRIQLSNLKPTENNDSIALKHKIASPDCICVKNMFKNNQILGSSRQFCERGTTLPPQLNNLQPDNIVQKMPLSNSDELNRMPISNNRESNTSAALSNSTDTKTDVVPSHYKKNKSTLVMSASEYRLPVPVKFAADGSYKVSSSGSRSEHSDSDEPVINSNPHPEPIAKIANYQSETARLASYGEWPDHAPVKPAVLARAGLFYTGTGDKVKCPFCLGSMYNWEEGDLPLNEHAKHYPACIFVKHKIYQNLYPENPRANPSVRPANNDVLPPANQGLLRNALSNNVQDSIVADASPFSITSDKQSNPAILKNVAFEDIPVVDIVKNMGYSIRMIRIAVRKIKDYSPLTLKSGELLDVIFNMEEDGYNSDDANDDGFYEGNQADEPQGAMAAELTATPKYAIDKFIGDDQTSDYGTKDSNSSTGESEICQLDGLESSKGITKVHKKFTFNRRILFFLAVILLTIPVLSIYLGYLIGTAFKPQKNIMPDTGVVVDSVHLNLSFYNTKTLTINFNGGLGSQMFQYAALYGIAKANGLRPIITDDSEAAKINEIFPYLNVKRTEKLDPGRYFSKFREHKKYAFDQRAFSLNYMKDITLEGGFQSWRYFDHVRKEIKMQFTFSKTAINIVQEFLHKSNAKLSNIQTQTKVGPDTAVQYVGINVRRGDILSEPNSKLGYVPADSNYLAASMQYFKHRFKTVIFVVTSDDLDWCRENIRTDMYLVVFSTYNHPGLDLCLLSQCNHTIITVGAFGWWGAWLAGGNTVYYAHFPKEGSELAGDFRFNDFYITQWLSL